MGFALEMGSGTSNKGVAFSAVFGWLQGITFIMDLKKA